MIINLVSFDVFAIIFFLNFR